MSKRKTARKIRAPRKTQTNKYEERFTELEQKIDREKVRINRVVQVLLHNLPRENLNTAVHFYGRDCNGSYRNWGYWDGKTVEDFLREVIDP